MATNEPIRLTPEDIDKAIKRIELEQDRLWDAYVLGMMRLRQRKDSLRMMNGAEGKRAERRWDFGVGKGGGR